MNAPLVHPRTGVRSYDAASFTRAVEVHGAFASDAGFNCLFQAATLGPVEITVPPAPDHVVLVWLDRLAPFRTGFGGPRPETLVTASRRRVAVLPAGMPSVWDSFAGTRATVHLHLSAQRLDALLGEPSPNGRVDVAPALVEQDEVIQQIGRSCKAELTNPGAGPGSKLLLESYALALAVRLFRAYRVGVRQEAQTHYALAPYRLSRVKAFIETHLTANMTLADLAGVAGLSAFHFARAFKKTTGLTPYRYVIERRVDKARECLADTCLGLADVALACGFSSQQQFTTMFRKVTGMTPGAYRRALRL